MLRPWINSWFHHQIISMKCLTQFLECGGYLDSAGYHYQKMKSNSYFQREKDIFEIWLRALWGVYQMPPKCLSSWKATCAQGEKEHPLVEPCTGGLLYLLLLLVFWLFSLQCCYTHNKAKATSGNFKTATIVKQHQAPLRTSQANGHFVDVKMTSQDLRKYHLHKPESKRDVIVIFDVTPTLWSLEEKSAWLVRTLCPSLSEIVANIDTVAKPVRMASLQGTSHIRWRLRAGAVIKLMECLPR